jgi:hypothetical protein
MTYDDLLITSPTARAIVMSGGSAQDVAVALYAEIEILSAKVAELSQIAPFRVTLEDGTVKVWRCPDEFVPMREVKSHVEAS